MLRPVLLTLIRHGESTFNADKRWQGHHDVPLSPRGEAQARALGRRLGGERFDRRVSSDLRRAAQTARAALGAEVEREPRLREVDVGRWAGLAHAEVAERFAEELRALRAGEPVRIGGGESMPEFETRIDALVDEWREHERGRALVAVSHGGVIRAIALRILDRRRAPSPLLGARNTSVTVVDTAGGRPRLRAYNDVGHLAGEPGPPDEPSGARVSLVAVGARVDVRAPAVGPGRALALGAARESPLARDLQAKPIDQVRLRDLALELADDEPAWVLAHPDRVPALVSEAVGVDPAALAPPGPGTRSVLRVANRSRLQLVSYGGQDDPPAPAVGDPAGPA